MADTTDFTCPRCARPATEQFYGPCGTCRSELVATMRREGEIIEVAAYEPKMNVVPNQIATKE